MRTRLFHLALGAAAGMAVVFLLAPVAALVLATPLRELPSLLRTPEVASALVVSLKANVLANACILGIGTPAAYLLSQRRFRGRTAVLTAIELPLVLPPAVAGIALLSLFGALGLLGPLLLEHGIAIPFTQAAVVLAVTFVAAPYYLRAAVGAFDAVDPVQLDAARDLGASEPAVFRRIALPLAADGLRTGWALAFARGAGEFGATLLFAGSVVGVTETLPLAVYAQLDVGLDQSVAVSLLLLGVSAAVLLVANLPPLWSPGAVRAAAPRW